MPEGEAATARDTAIPDTGQRIEIAYRGSLEPVARIAAANGLFSLVTLGFYRFWGKTRLRRYFWGHVSVGGDRLEYTGLAKELLIGFLIALAILIPIFLVNLGLELVLAPDSIWLVVENFVYGIVLWFLINVAIFRARRYRLTRTRWRGIRFRQTGKSVEYALIAMGWQFLTSLTLGLAFPVYRMRVQQYLIEHTGFGTEMFRFSGRGGALFGTWFIAWLLFFPSLGISYLWYRAREFNYVAASITAKGFRAESTLRTGQLLKIFLIYGLLTVAVVIGLFMVLRGLAPNVPLLPNAETGEWSLNAESRAYDFLVIIGVGLAFLFCRGVLLATFMLHPILRAVCQSLTFFGGNDLESVLQAAASDITYGEGLADAFDVGDF